MMFGEEEGMMSSECSSGCQSGWTMYLEQSSYDAQNPLLYNKTVASFYEEEEEEDLSMVSDASSGPPHFVEDDEQQYYNTTYHQYCYQGNGCLCAHASAVVGGTVAKDSGKKRRVEDEQQQQQHSSLLDDTASSPLYSQSKASFRKEKHMKSSMDDIMEFSCDFSATHFKGKSALQNQMVYLQSPAHSKLIPRPLSSRKACIKKM